MTYSQFKSQLIETLQQDFFPDAEIIINQVNKNNGICLDGLVIKEKEGNIFPTIYLENFYKDYSNGETFDDVVKKIADVHKSNRVDDNFDVSGFFDFDKVKDHIIFRLVNREKNQELLEGIPSREYFDLVIIFYYILPESMVEDGTCTILIRNEHIAKWNVTVDELMELAIENTPRIEGVKIQGLLETVASLVGSAQVDTLADNSEMYMPTYVVTNNHLINGAGVILYKDTLPSLAAKLKSDLFILPCSVHEVIVLCANNSELSWIEYLKNMVSKVNKTELEEIDYLSDNVYMYSRETRQLSVC